MIGTLAQELFRHNDNKQGISAKWGDAGGTNQAMLGEGNVHESCATFWMDLRGVTAAPIIIRNIGILQS